MRKGGGKGKGGAYENQVARLIAKAFSDFDITEDDVYRTKNSGATKRQPGDIQLSPALSKLFPALFECKHYRKVGWIIGKPIQNQYAIFRKWWEQSLREQKERSDRFAVLIFRANHCPDMVAYIPGLVDKFIDMPRKFNNIIKTQYKGKSVWIIPLKDFLTAYVNTLQVKGLKRDKGSSNKQRNDNRNGTPSSASPRKVPKHPRTQLGNRTDNSRKSTTKNRPIRRNA